MPGSSTGANVNIGGDQTFHGDMTVNPTPQSTAELDKLLAQLQQAIASPGAPPESAAIIAEAAAVVDEAKQGTSREITRENLHQAASNIANVMPAVGVIVYQILGIVQRLGA